MWPEKQLDQVELEKYWRTDRYRLRACVNQFVDYRDSVEERDAALTAGGK